MSTSARYWREIPQRYRYEAAKCTGCGAVHFPPRLICRECKNRKFEKVVLSGKGKVETFTVIRVAPSEYTDEAPYPIGIIELDDGVKIQCQIADCPAEEIRIGMPVRIEFRLLKEEGEAGILCYGFKAVPAGD